MKLAPVLFLAALMSQSVLANTTADKNEIKKMAGCYAVHFQNADTFRLDDHTPFYPAHSSRGLEWVVVDHESADQVELQHLLITPVGIVKHWRQVWDYQSVEHLNYTDHLQWSKNKLSREQAKGEWTQRVYQVDDSPRYECSAAWVHARAGSFWECTADAPLPRREFSQRSDYNILQRKNRHFSDQAGWVHEQDNVKINRVDGVDQKLMMEKGYQTYTKVADHKCEPAQKWWQERRAFWKEVQKAWSQALEQRDVIKLTTGAVWQKLFALDESWAQRDFHAQSIRQEARAVIEDHLRD